MTATHPDYDVIVVGSGVAGLSTALGLADTRRVALVTSGTLGGGSTEWAQGGLAAAIGPDDDPRFHAEDTATAGAGYCNRSAVDVLVDGAPNGVADLLRAGGQLDRYADGSLALTREGGHRHRRIVHAGGDATGAEVSGRLVDAVRRAGVDVIEHTAVTDVQVSRSGFSPVVTGVTVRRTSQCGSEDGVLTARSVVLATGGVGGLYETSTNPAEVAGEGLGLALRAGASLIDLEFVQFHPTALSVGSPSGQIPLITEALRGEGAVLIDDAGDRIMSGLHPLADLAPRDVVARRIDEVRKPSVGSAGQVFLDATALGAALLKARFPTVYDACRQVGIDPARQPIPVEPVQHFLCGGIRTDLWGATDVEGLSAVGEAAATGVHGANRLASNSLVEGLVFGRRVASRLALDLPAWRRTGAEDRPETPRVGDAAIPQIRSIMSRHAGIRRSGDGLAVARAELDALADTSPVGASFTAGNRWLAANAIVVAAAARRESRGCHWRSDYPKTSDRPGRHVVLRCDDDGRPKVVADRLERSA